MKFFPATRGEHIHVRPHRGRLKKTDRIKGYQIVGYEMEDGQFQDTIILVDGEKMTLVDFMDTLPGNMRADTIPFPVYRQCCDIQYVEEP